VRKRMTAAMKRKGDGGGIVQVIGEVRAEVWRRSGWMGRGTQRAWRADYRLQILWRALGPESPRAYGDEANQQQLVATR
jgi:hypothetical protein